MLATVGLQACGIGTEWLLQSVEVLVVRLASAAIAMVGGVFGRSSPDRMVTPMRNRVGEGWRPCGSQAPTQHLDLDLGVADYR
jgi:hypothetical protein